MAQLLNSGLLGLKGKLGNVVVYEAYGQQLVRTRPGNYNDRKSEAQLVQRQRLAKVQQFLKCFRHLIKMYNQPETPGKTAYGEAVSWNLKNGLVGEYPHIAVDFAKAQFIKGPLPGAEFTKVARQGNVMQLEWIDGAQAGGHAHDVLQLVFLPVDGQRAFDADGNAQRKAQQATAAIGWPSNEPVHLWAFFASVRLGTVSACSYLGCL